MKSNEELAAELVNCRSAIRDLYALQCRFKPGSFERNPMPALERVLGGEEQFEEFAAHEPEKVIDLD